MSSWEKRLRTAWTDQVLGACGDCRKIKSAFQKDPAEVADVLVGRASVSVDMSKLSVSPLLRSNRFACVFLGHKEGGTSLNRKVEPGFMKYFCLSLLLVNQYEVTPETEKKTNFTVGGIKLLKRTFYHTSHC